MGTGAITKDGATMAIGTDQAHTEETDMAITIQEDMAIRVITAIGTDKAHSVGATIKTMITRLDTDLQAPTAQKNPAIWTIMAIGKDRAHRLGATINATITRIDMVNTTGKTIGAIKISQKPRLK